MKKKCVKKKLYKNVGEHAVVGTMGSAREGEEFGERPGE